MAKARKQKAAKPRSTQRPEPTAPAGKPTPPLSAIPADAVTATDRDPLIFGPLPTTATGKIQKFVLREQARSI